MIVVTNMKMTIKLVGGESLQWSFWMVPAGVAVRRVPYLPVKSHQSLTIHIRLLQKTNLWKIFDDLGSLQVAGFDPVKFSAHVTTPSLHTVHLNHCRQYLLFLSLGWTYLEIAFPFQVSKIIFWVRVEVEQILATHCLRKRNPQQKSEQVLNQPAQNSEPTHPKFVKSRQKEDKWMKWIPELEPLGKESQPCEWTILEEKPILWNVCMCVCARIWNDDHDLVLFHNLLSVGRVPQARCCNWQGWSGTEKMSIWRLKIGKHQTFSVM